MSLVLDCLLVMSMQIGVPSEVLVRCIKCLKAIGAHAWLPLAVCPEDMPEHRSIHTFLSYADANQVKFCFVGVSQECFSSNFHT